jgi:outer membrane protein assembly factor BamB
LSPHARLSLLSLLLVSLTAAFAQSARAIEPTPKELAEMQAQADEWFQAAATASPNVHLSAECSRAFREAYVGSMTREVLPCNDLESAVPRQTPTSALEQWRRVRAGTAGPSARAQGGPDTVQCWGKVFIDTDEDGQYDAGEPGIENIAVSNGMQSTILGNGVKLTLADGTFTFTTPLSESRFVFVTVPSGYTGTNSFFHKLNPANAPDTAYFGLRLTPATSNPVFRWVQMSDTHMFDDPATGVNMSDDVTEIEGLPQPAAFIIVTGDLTNSGDHDQQFQNYLDGIAGHAIPIHSGYGDHDASSTNPLVAKFESYLGPTCYSFEYGGVHFILYNDIYSVSEGGAMVQFGWLALDIVTARARDPQHSIPIVICKHTMPLNYEINYYKTLTGIVGTFSGHWHGSRVRLLEGIFDVHVPPSRFAGIDKSSRGFRVNDMANGAITTEYRLAGIVDQSTITLPADQDTVVAGLIPIRVNTYDSQAKMTSGTFQANGPISTGSLPLTADGPWAWKGTWDASLAPDGVYTITSTILPQVGAPIVRNSTVTLLRAGVPFPDPYTDWPCFKHDPQGTSYTGLDLRPPFRIAWVKHLGGRNNVESPVVAGGKVFVGTSNISTVNEAAMSCFDAVSGDLLWRFPARTDVKSTPAVSGGKVYFSNSIGTLFALNAANGNLVWSTQLGDSLTRWEMTSPTVVGDTVYAGGISVMSALNATTGAVLWQQVGEAGSLSDFIPSIYSAPAVKDDIVVFTTRGGIFAFNRHTGAPAWQFTGTSQQHRSAGITGNLVYSVGGPFGNQKLKAYDLTTGGTIYSATFTQNEATSAPAVTPNNRIITVHGGNPEGTVAIFEGFLPTLGTDLMWTFFPAAPIACSRPYQRTTGSINSTPAVANQIAYVGADDGHLYGVNIVNGAELWRHDFGVPVRSSPAIAGNMLFITTEDGSLYAFVSGYVSTTGTGPVAASPRVTRLIGARPNPFQAGGALAFELAGTGAAAQVPATLRIYDPAGRLVRTLVKERLVPGLHSVPWDARGDDGRPVASGVYFVTLDSGGRTFRDRLVLVR